MKMTPEERAARRKETNANYRERNREILRQRQAKFNNDHRDEILSSMNERNANKRAENVEYKQRYSKTVHGGYLIYKYNAADRNIMFDLTESQFAEFAGVPCVYCGSTMDYIGIDRIDNSIGYTLGNSASCCSMCNFMKRTHSELFIKTHVMKLITFQSNPYTIHFTHSDVPRAKKMFSSYKCRCKRIGRDFLMTLDQFIDMVHTTCSYCGSGDGIGVDRIDNTKGYIDGNIAPCCATCNFMKRTHPVDAFLFHIGKMYAHLGY